MIYRVYTLCLSSGFMIQNEFRDYKIHPALKIGRKFDHALTRYDVRHFV